MHTYPKVKIIRLDPSVEINESADIKNGYQEPENGASGRGCRSRRRSTSARNVQTWSGGGNSQSRSGAASGCFGIVFRGVNGGMQDMNINYLPSEVLVPAPGAP
jgi:hypothetical protein